MDALEFLSAMIDRAEKHADHHVFNQTMWDHYVRHGNRMVNLIEAAGGQMYSDADVHDTGECCCE